VICHCLLNQKKNRVMIIIGQIKEVSEIEELKTGFKIQYELEIETETKNGVIKELRFIDFFNKERKYIDDFVKFNTVGKFIEVEIKISCHKSPNPKGGYYRFTSLKHWNIVRNDSSNQSEDSQDDLPF
jgi:hypothetical protein